METPPTLAIDWIAGSFGSARATDDGGVLEVEVTAPADVVVAGEAPFPPPSPEQAATAAAVSSTRTERTRIGCPPHLVMSQCAAACAQVPPLSTNTIGSRYSSGPCAKGGNQITRRG
jgi:hypothetical protein